MQYLVKVLEHNEKNPSLTSLRHPLVVLFHLPFVVILLGIYLLSAKTPGQTLYFIVAVALYLSSAAYHAWKPNWFLRFVDQTMISWYVVVTPFPFIYQEAWAIPYIGCLMVLTAMNKWYEWETGYTIGSIVFFALGAVSALMVFSIGLPNIGVSLYSLTSFWIVVAIACFIGKLVIYQYRKLNLVTNVWESPESGHCVLSLGVTIYSLVVMAYPV